MSRRSRSTSAPVSFFAFQDIVTSVTGILILITLLMTLELVTRAEVRDLVPAQKADLADTELRLAQQDRLRMGLKRQISEANAFLATLGSLSPLETSKQTSEIRSDIIALIANDAATTQLIRGIETELRQLRAQLQEATTGAKVTETEATKVESDTATMKKTGRLHFIAGKSEKTPIVVECRNKLVRAGTVGADGDLRNIGEWSSGASRSGLSRLASSRGANREYFVFYVRPDAVQLSDELIDAMRIQGFDVGWEPLDEGSDIFPR